MHSDDVEKINDDSRFAFGENWARFLDDLNGERICHAEQSLLAMLKVKDLQGKRFLDIGSGSGLFSLAARRLGATVHSFDYDTQSVACTNELKHQYFPNDANWIVEQGSVLDEAYVSGLGHFDVVYSWGVLHHTGHMFGAFANVASTISDHGQLFIAIYNDQGFISKYWYKVKWLYNKNLLIRLLIVAIHVPYLFVGRWIFRFLTGRLSLERGMSLWHDMIDWLGGYPFEVAKPEVIIRFFGDKGYILEELITCGGKMGCNEFVFRRKA